MKQSKLNLSWKIKFGKAKTDENVSIPVVEPYQLASKVKMKLS